MNFVKHEGGTNCLNLPLAFECLENKRVSSIPIPRFIYVDSDKYIKLLVYREQKCRFIATTHSYSCLPWNLKSASDLRLIDNDEFKTVFSSAVDWFEKCNAQLVYPKNYGSWTQVSETFLNIQNAIRQVAK